MDVNARLADLTLCVVDVETTGACFAYGDRVVEIGLTRLERGQITRTYQRLVDPGRPISAGASAVTGITDAMVAGQPTFGRVWPEIRDLTAGAVLVGHNIQFDLSFLDGECRRFGRGLADEIGEPAVLDTLRIARRQFGRGGNGLQRLAARLEVPAVTAHRALADCLTTAAVLDRILAGRGGWELTLAAVLALQGPAPRWPAGPTRGRVVAEELSVALVAGEKVTITYLDASRLRSQRTVTPVYVRRIRGSMTLVAHCHLRGEQRTFRLDRILSVIPADEPADSGPHASPCPPYNPDHVEFEP